MVTAWTSSHTLSSPCTVVVSNIAEPSTGVHADFDVDNIAGYFILVLLPPEGFQRILHCLKPTYAVLNNSLTLIYHK